MDRARQKQQQVNPAELPDVYEPLQTLTEYLLPHLKFSRIDFANEDNIRCLWSRTDRRGVIELDIDDLSSGEKAIVILFISLLEEQIQERLVRLEAMGTGKAAPEETTRDRVVLIDEPEQHLHPDLQAKILSYMRTVARESKVQFVITTHSPTILDQAFDEELFALYPPSGDVAENQLRRIATNAERLETLKQLTGSAYFLTTGRVIVCIEGEPGAQLAEASDLGLLETMYPRATAFTLVPTKGKGNVINTVQSLRDYVSAESFRITIRGLVDADQSGQAPEGIVMLPVCMIENLLLDADALLEYLRSLQYTHFVDANAVNEELNDIIRSLRDEEVELRVRNRIKGWMVRIGGASLQSVKDQHAAELERLRTALPDDKSLSRIITEVATSVDQMISSGTAIDRFRGKQILKEFHRRHVANLNVGFKPMCIALAKGLATAGKVAPRLDPIFDQLEA